MFDHFIVGVELRDVFKELITIATKWCDIGISLGLPYHTIEVISHEYFCVNDRCRAVIVTWLKGNGTPVSWASLISALERMDERRVAETLRDKYTLVPSGMYLRLPIST